MQFFARCINIPRLQNSPKWHKELSILTVGVTVMIMGY